MKKKLKENKNRLLFEETNISNNYKEKIEEKSLLEQENQRELQRMAMIIEKFTKYNLSISDTEIEETKQRLSDMYPYSLNDDGLKFHCIFLKVMDFEIEQNKTNE